MNVMIWRRKALVVVGFRGISRVVDVRRPNQKEKELMAGRKTQLQQDLLSYTINNKHHLLELKEELNHDALPLGEVLQRIN